MRIYLAGRCNQSKWRLVPTPAQAEWLASDGSSSDRDHGWDYEMKGHDEPLIEDRARFVRTEALELLDACDLVVAYVEDTAAYGAIAEVAYAAAIGKPVLFFLKITESTEAHEHTFACLEMYENSAVPVCGIEVDWFSNRSAMDDAYWFVSAMPNVVLVQIYDADIAARMCLNQLDRIESPIELRFYLAMVAHRNVDDLVAQHAIDRYRVDFAFTACRVVVECDGHAFHSSKEQRNHDTERERVLMRHGWTVVRFTGSQIHADPVQCVSDLNAITRRLPLREG